MPETQLVKHYISQTRKKWLDEENGTRHEVLSMRPAQDFFEKAIELSEKSGGRWRSYDDGNYNQQYYRFIDPFSQFFFFISVICQKQIPNKEIKIIKRD